MFLLTQCGMGTETWRQEVPAGKTPGVKAFPNLGQLLAPWAVPLGTWEIHAHPSIHGQARRWSHRAQKWSCCLEGCRRGGYISNSAEQNLTTGPLCDSRRVSSVTRASLGGGSPHPPWADGVHELPGTPSVTSPSRPVFSGADSWAGCLCGVAAPRLPAAKFLPAPSLSGPLLRLP